MDVEGRIIGRYLIPQRRKAGVVYFPPPPQNETVRLFLQFQLAARFYTQRLQHLRG